MSSSSIPDAIARQNRKRYSTAPSEPAPPSEALTRNIKPSRSTQIGPIKGRHSGTSVLPSAAAKRAQGG